MKIKITYFKPSGKYYSEGEYETNKIHHFEIIDEIHSMFNSGECPGLTNNSVNMNKFYALIEPQNENLSVPHLIIPK